MGAAGDSHRVIMVDAFKRGQHRASVAGFAPDLSSLAQLLDLEVEREERSAGFSMIAFMYWLYYVLPLFWEPHTISEIYSPVGRELSDAGITRAMLMAVLGVGCLWLGMHARVGKLLAPRRLTINLAPSRRPYIRAVLAVGCFLNVYDISPYILGEGEDN